jgi:hypothetical protein
MLESSRYAIDVMLCIFTCTRQQTVTLQRYEHAARGRTECELGTTACDEMILLIVNDDDSLALLMTRAGNTRRAPVANTSNANGVSLVLGIVTAFCHLLKPKNAACEHQHYRFRQYWYL